MSTKKIFAVIPTFNRKDLVELTSAYLRRIAFDPGRFSFVISDDCSEEYGLMFLQAVYSTLPNATFMKTSRNAGPVGHVWSLLKLFVGGEHGKVLILDSDLIVDESCLRCIDDFESELVSSLYNSCFHVTVEEHEGYCTKADIGWAGALIDQSVVSEMFRRHGSRPFDDWALCEFAKRARLTIKASKPSVVEHIGVSGMNNAAPEYFDHSIDFPRDHVDEATRNYFLRTRGFDLLQYLETRPNPLLRSDSLNVFGISTPKNV